MSRVAIAAGGTGGHVFPALAVAEALRERGVEVHFLGTASGLEARAVPAAGFPLTTLDVSGVRRAGWRRRLGLPLALGRSVAAAWRALRTIRPAVVLGMGGYASAPAGLAARLRGARLVVHEQNAVPGLTNRLLAPLARRVLAGFPEAARRLGRRAEAVGIPVRRSLLGLPGPRERLGGRSGPLRVLVFGGSQGARFLNETVPAGLLRAAQSGVELEVRHQSGGPMRDQVAAAYAEAPFAAGVESFIDDMAEAYTWCDLAFCRAGAGTVAELAAVGVPAVLVPYPYAVDDHQRRNAQALADRDAAVLVDQGDTNAGGVADWLRGELGDRERLAAMGEAARGWARPDAAEVVAAACLGETHARA
jgi:UDP-N-acetylglucosamine--N-acetylmuramyl-(pentapeptide) pyrophosphoryl-undecaprenol N-acetylglucosamine transferase